MGIVKELVKIWPNEVCDTPETSEHVTIQVDEEVSKVPMNVEARPENDSEVENLVAEDDNANQQE